jgi:hypothetical protein
MVIPCAFYGFVNRTTKVTLQVDQEQLEVGRAIVYEGDDYIILSVFEADGYYHANVGLAHLHRTRPPSRLKTIASHTLPVGGKDTQDHRGDPQKSAVQIRLQTAETTIQDLLRERDEILKRLEEAIQQLDRLHQSARM